MVSRRILACLFLTLLLQYGDAWKSHYLEPVLTSLQRIENMLLKQTEQNALSCVVPCEKLFDVPSDNLPKASDGDTNEPSSRKQLDSILVNFRRSMSHSDEEDNDSSLSHIGHVLKKQRQKRRRASRNENVNSNTNTNINSNSNRARLFDYDTEYD